MFSKVFNGVTIDEVVQDGVTYNFTSDHYENEKTIGCCRMAKFCTKYEQEERRPIKSTDVLSGYRQGVMLCTYNDLQKMLNGVSSKGDVWNEMILYQLHNNIY